MNGRLAKHALILTILSAGPPARADDAGGSDAMSLCVANAIGDPVPLDRETTGPTVDYYVQSSSLAWGADEYLAVWIDGRTNLGPRLFGTRIRADGTMLDEVAFPIVERRAESASVSFDGSNFVVTWLEQLAYSNEIRFARIAPSGRILDPGGALIPTGMTGAVDPHIASARGVSLVTWSDGAGVRGIRVASDGRVLDTAPTDLSAFGEGDCVTFDGTNFVVGFSVSTRGLFPAAFLAVRVALDGLVLDPSAIPIYGADGLHRGLRLGSNGETTLFAWTEHRSDGEGVFVARMAPNGAVLDPAGIRIASERGEPNGVTFARNRFLVSYYVSAGPELSHSAIASVGADGSVDESMPRSPCTAVSDGCYAIGLASSSDSVVTIDEWRSTALVADSTLSTTTALRLARGAPRQHGPGVAFDGHEYLVAWGEDSRVSAMHVARDGTLLDRAPLRIEAPAFGSVRVVASDRGFFLHWRTTSPDEWALAFVGDHDAGPPTTPRFFEDVADRPGLQWDGVEFLLEVGGQTWDRMRGTPDVDLWRFGADGSLLDQRPLALDPDGQAPHFIANAWHLLRLEYDRDWWRVRQAATRSLEPFGNEVIVWDLFGDSPWTPGRDDFLMLVDRDPRYPVVASIVRVDRDGTLEAIENGFRGPRTDALSWDGYDYFATSSFDETGPTSTWSAVRLSGNGSALDSVAFPLSPSRPATNPALAFADDHSGLMTYETFVPEAPFGAVRVHARRLDLSAESYVACDGGPLDDAFSDASEIADGDRTANDGSEEHTTRDVTSDVPSAADAASSADAFSAYRIASTPSCRCSIDGFVRRDSLVRWAVIAFFATTAISRRRRRS